MPADKKKHGYEDIKADKVIEAISKGKEIIACNLAALTITVCDDLKIGALRALMANEAVVFYEKVTVDE